MRYGSKANILADIIEPFCVCVCRTYLNPFDILAHLVPVGCQPHQTLKVIDYMLVAFPENTSQNMVYKTQQHVAAHANVGPSLNANNLFHAHL